MTTAERMRYDLEKLTSDRVAAAHNNEALADMARRSLKEIEAGNYGRPWRELRNQILNG